MVEDATITVDWTKTEWAPIPTSGKRRPRLSRPGEKIYQQRRQWWLDHKFGEEAADWAAKWRLGEPLKKGLKEEDKEYTSVKNAIRVGNRRVYTVRYRMKQFGETEAQAIKHLDDELRMKDKADKVKRNLVESDISIYHKKIEPNIYKDIS